MVSLPSSMCRHPCRHHNGVVALAAMTFLPLMRRHVCRHHDGDCCPHCDGVSAIVKLTYSLSWCCCLETMGLLLLSMRRFLCCYQAGVVTLIAMVLPSLMRKHLCSPGTFAIIAIMLLPSLQWHHCCHQAGVVTHVTMASLPLSMCRRLCCCHDGIVALVALAPLPTLHRCCCPCCASVVVIILLTSLPSRCMGIVTIVAPVLLPPSSWHVCAMECGYNYLRLLDSTYRQHINVFKHFVYV